MITKAHLWWAVGADVVLLFIALMADWSSCAGGLAAAGLLLIMMAALTKQSQAQLTPPPFQPQLLTPAPAKILGNTSAGGDMASPGASDLFIPDQLPKQP